MTKRALFISGIAWNATYQRHQLNANILAELGYQVDFLQSCKTSRLGFSKIFYFLFLKLIKGFGFNKKCIMHNVKNSNIRVITSNFLPPGGKLNLLCNRLVFMLLLGRKLHRKYDVVFYYVPIDILRFLERSEDTLVIYDCVRAFSQWGGYDERLYENEKELVDSADHILCDSYYLKEIHLPSIANSKEIEQLIPPVEVKRKEFTTEYKRINKVGYFGSISEHIDVEVFFSLIEQGYEIYYWGGDESLLPVEVNRMGYEADQNLLLQQIVDTCDALIIPYKGAMNGVYPAKLSISLSSGLPVYCSSFYDSNRLSDILYVYSSSNELLTMLSDFCPTSHQVKQIAADKFLNHLDITSYTRVLKRLLGAS
ncbi:hypothetical protein QLG02_00955 [Aeromonas sp. V90_14]|uniref:hypothetical protein n=1 Tax=Aeromonas sp. V90_14 TaxID=3044241 RepID=UPI00249EBA26|nr:hypothetical protein [Aeromonas sp. V90_14]MDI3428899.1 hypothetical protein [Aeromonas sp. V90_14]